MKSVMIYMKIGNSKIAVHEKLEEIARVQNRILEIIKELWSMQNRTDQILEENAEARILAPEKIKYLSEVQNCNQVDLY